MKIVQILESSATGTLAIVTMIANRLASEGHDVHVIYSSREDTPRGIRTMFDGRVVLHRVQMRSRLPLSPIVALRRKLTHLRPDVVHLHSSFAGFLGRLAALCALKETAFFYSPHGISFMRRDISNARRRMFVMLEWIASIRRCRYVACSGSERDAIRAYLGCPVQVLENAVDAVALPPAQAARRGASPVLDVVTAGGMRPQKNPSMFAEIARRMRGAGIRFTWIGDGDDVLKRELGDAGVHVTGWISREAVQGRLGRADVYLSTASWEGMSVSLIEAMWQGLAVVSARCAGNVDVIAHERTGLLFGDVDAAVQSLGRLACEPALRARLGDAARAEARTRFTATRFFRQLLRLYAVKA